MKPQTFARAGDSCVELYTIGEEPKQLTWEQALHLGSRLIDEAMALRAKEGWVSPELSRASGAG